MKFAVVLSFLLLALTPNLTFARDLTYDEKMSDLRQVVSVMKAGYGPLLYKKSIGIDLDTLSNTYAEKIKLTKTNGEFYYLMVQFVAAMKDSHFRANLPTKVLAQLPFDTDLVGGKVLITSIDREKLSEKDFPFVKGDEVVAIDGVSSAVLLDNLSSYVSAGYDLTARRKAATAFTYRSASTFPAPSGDVKVDIRRGTSEIIETAKLKWEVTGTPFDEGFEKPESVANNLRVPVNYDDLSMDMFDPQAERTFRCSGDTRIEIPSDATVIMKTPFVAYYYPTSAGNVGYLRIPHYYWQSDADKGEDKYDEVFLQYEYALNILEKNTVGLIIDQDHNCGGSVDFLHRMVGLFISTPVDTMKFQLLATKESYLPMNEWVKGTPENTLIWEELKKLAELIKTTWLKGDFLTPMTSLTGTSKIYPNTSVYTKPIVMLIDEMSGSGGDAFPSLMQGYGRAKLLGTRTMGAGGHVVEEPNLFFSQINLRMTKSLFFRPDGVPVENNGAVPDISYSPTREDVMYGYKNYQKFYTSKLIELLPK